MLLLVGLFALLLIAAASAPASYDAKQGKKHYEECQVRHDATMRDLARKTDSYYSSGSLSSYNENFYSDGSLKHDPFTGKNYPKGQYMCRSDGLTADYRRVGNDVKRPPR